MTRQLFLTMVFIFLVGDFVCEAQTGVAARTRTLSGSQSSGGGQGGGCGYAIVPSTKFLCMDSAKTLSIKYIFTGNNLLQTGNLKIYSVDSVFLDSSFNDQFLDDSAMLSIVVQKPGTYYFDLKVPGSEWTDDAGFVHPGPANCHAEWVVTSTIPIDIPSQTSFCNAGSALLNAPDGSIGPFQWFYNGDSIVNETSGTYVASQTGNYFVRSSVDNGCVVNSDKVNVTIYDTSPQSIITGPGTVNSPITLDNSAGDLAPQTITWYRDNNPIKTIDNSATVLAGGNNAGSGLNQLDQPYGIFIDSVKNIYVADYNNYRVMKWAAGSTSGTTFVANIDQSGGHPTDISIDSMITYVSTTKNMLQFSSSFILSKPFNYNTWGVSSNTNHDLYFSNDADEFNSVGGGIYKIDSTGNVAGNNQGGSSLSSINYPNGVYVDSLNDLYVADNLTDNLNNYFGRILKWIPGATAAELIAGGNGFGNAPNQIAFAAGVTFDKRKNLYVSDADNKRVQLWKPGAGHGITISGGFTPWGIKVDDSDNVYVADQTNNQVIRFPSLLYNTIIGDEPGVYKAVVTYAGNCTTTTNDFIVSGPLPLTLLNFTGQLNNSDVLLSWQTGSESNTSHFNIQRSIDAVNFYTIGKTGASGNSTALHNYIFSDKNIISLNAHKIYYRVSEMDIDGASIQSNIISIDIKKLGWDFTVNPNPVKSALKIQLNRLHGNTNVAIVDMTGRKVHNQQINATGNDVLNFNTVKLSAGLYVIQITSNGQSEYLKFVKE
ncbi:MAG: T9SS type A sorting domain-containing protein [Ginsengibacter sp.]